MCIHPLHIEVKNQHPDRFKPNASYAYDVPCGKCLECLKRRQSDYATRIYREASKGGRMYFITLTYRDEALPLSKRLFKADKDTGLVDAVTPYEIETDKRVLSEIRLDMSRIKVSSVARYVDREVFQTDSVYWYARFTPSLNRLDVRNWLKVARIVYKRKNGFPLPDFRYAFCGEYGPKGSRPHYHMILFGLEPELVSWLVGLWDSKYGYTLTKEVPIKNADGSDARLIVSRYVGKYIAKGKFDLDSVKNRDAEKGRLCNSLRLGTQLSDNEYAYFRCYDLFGKYDVFTLLKDGKKPWHVDAYLNDDELTAIAKQVIQRNSITLNSFKGDGTPVIMPMPKALRYHLWYRREVLTLENNNSYEDKIKVFLIGSPVLAKIQDLLRAKFANRGKQLYKKLYPEVDVSTICPETFVEFYSLCKRSEEHPFEAFQEFKFQTTEYRDSKDNQ